MKDIHIHDKIELGFIFEYAFNLGIYGILRPYINNSNKDLELLLDKHLDNSEMHRKNIHQIMIDKFKINDLDTENKVIAAIDKLLFIGYQGGQGFMTEFLKSKNLISSIKFADQEKELEHIKKSRFTVDLFYFNIVNPLGIQSSDLDQKRFKFTQEMFNIAFNDKLSEEEYKEYTIKGQFLNADSLIMFGKRREKYILVIDNKIKLTSALKYGDCHELLDTLTMLLNEKSKKIKFNNLDADSSFIESFKLAPKLIDYAATMGESSLLKTAQAGSYAHSFLSMLNSKRLINKDVVVSISGYFDSEYSFINYPKCNHNDPKLLDSLFEFKEAYLEWERKEIDEDSFLKQRTVKQKSIYTSLKKNMIKDTFIPKEQIKELEIFNREQGTIVLTEHIEGFTPTSMELRQDHSKVVYSDIMNPDIPIVILNGCPGIGKTTTNVNAAKTFDKFTFMYISPRTALGDDIIHKFKDDDGFYADDFITISTSSKDEEHESGLPIVNFLSNSKVAPASHDLLFLPQDRFRDHFSKDDKPKFEMKTYNKVAVVEEGVSGTLARLCKGQRACIEDKTYNKILSVMSIQATKKKGYKLTTEHLLTTFPFIIKNNSLTGDYHIDRDAFLNFAEKMPNVFIMIDEITGTDEGVALYRSLKKMLFNPLSKLPSDIRRKLNLKLIVADASLTNATIIQHHLEGSKINQIIETSSQKLYLSKVDDEDKLALSRKILDTKIGPVSIINANSYPAGKLKINYHINLSKTIIKEEEADSTVFKKNDRQDQDIINSCMDYLVNRNELQAIIYVQDIRRLDSIVDNLKEEYKRVTGVNLEENKDYIIITSRLSPDERNEIIEYNNRQSDALDHEKRLRIVFMTSSASRGISFKDCGSIHCVSQLFSIESSLMEIVQLVYRCRGHKTWDIEKEKELNFYIIQNIYATSEDEFEYKKYKTLSAVLSYIALLRGSILTRIQGYTTIGGQELSLIPLGSTGVQGISTSIVEYIAEALKEVKKEIAIHKQANLIELRKELENLFSGLVIDTHEQILYNNKDEVTNEANVYSNFLNTLNKGPIALTKKRFFKDFYIINGLIVFSISDAEDLLHLLKDKLLRNKNIYGRLHYIIGDKSVPDKIRKPLNSIYELLKFERNNHTKHSKALSEEDNVENRFIAFPLDSFRMYDQFKDMTIEDNKLNFGQVMHRLIQNYVSVHSVLPIVTDSYEGLPFITFKSSDLEAKRLNLFKDNYLMTSTELNILNLLLLGK